MKIAIEAQMLAAQLSTRRHFLKRCSAGLGGMAMASFLGCNSLPGKSFQEDMTSAVLDGMSHFPNG